MDNAQFRQDLINMMPLNDLVADELNKAIRKFPQWPVSISSAHLILAEEFGELSKALCEYQWGRGPKEAVICELAQTGAMLHRLYDHLNRTEEQGQLSIEKAGQ
jgi:hypothetical protein